MQDPFGLERRRRFSVEGHHLLDILDEVFDDPDSMLSGMAGGIADPLLAELERARTGEMRDIVATIQAEQDVVVRAGLDVCLVVQGGPGTGKTAVGLHRAAYLHVRAPRAAHRVASARDRPEPRLPALHLAGLAVARRDVGGADHRAGAARRVASPCARPSRRLSARVKGDARMADVMPQRVPAAAIGRPPRRSCCATRWGPVRLSPGRVSSALDGALALAPVVAARSRRVPRAVLALMLDGLERVRPDVLGHADEQIAEDLRSDRTASGALDRIWPTISAPAVVRRSSAAAPASLVAADGMLDADEQGLLQRKAVGSAANEPWTTAGHPAHRRGEGLIAGPPRRYGHIVVDEAQDLSAMALRVLARRAGPRPSMTILGDLAQATTAVVAAVVGGRARCTSACRPTPRSRSSRSATGCPARSSRWPIACCPRPLRRCARLDRCVRTARRRRSWSVAATSSSPPSSQRSPRSWATGCRSR